MEMIPDCVWKEIELVIPKKKSLVGRPESDARSVLSGIFFIMRTGAQWKNLPKSYGAASTVHGKFRRWIELGVFDQIMRIANRVYSRSAEDYWLAVDTSHSKAPLANWSGKNPTDRGKKGVKKVLITDRHGAPLAVCAAPSNVHDSKLLKPAVKTLNAEPTKYLRVLAADSAFDAEYLRCYCRKNKLLLIAVTNIRRGKDITRNRVKGRWVIERTFGWLAWYRGLKICWSKTVESFVALLQLAASLQLFRMA